MKNHSKQGLHSGHRARLKERFRTAPDSFNDHELLELLLFYAIPQKDTNALAHQLIRRFGSLAAVLDAPLTELCAAGGIGESSATLFCAMRALFQRYLQEKSERICPVSQISEQQIGDRIMPEYLSLQHERVMVVGLNRLHRVIGSARIGEGDDVSSPVNMSQLADFIRRTGAKYVVLAHNHPSGVSLPSSEDYMATEQVSSFVRQLGAQLIDHIIFDCHGDYISFLQSGMIGTDKRPAYRVTRNTDQPVIRKLSGQRKNPIVAEILQKWKEIE